MRELEKGPWKIENRSKKAVPLSEKCNIDSEGKPRCENGHYLKRFKTPLENKKETEKVRCNVCKKSIKFEKGYWNCNQGC